MGLDTRRGEPPNWRRDLATRQTGGRYEVNCEGMEGLWVVRIEADGYMPGVSRGFPSTDDGHVYDFKLRRGVGISGVVRLRDGRPLAGAEVALLVDPRAVHMMDGHLGHPEAQPVTITDSDGRFHFPPQDRACSVLVLEDRGSAHVSAADLAADGNIQIVPWGTVEGEVRIGSRLAVREPVQLDIIRENSAGVSPGPRFPYWATTDADGRFSFARVPPGQATIGRVIPIGNHALATTRNAVVEVQPGERVRIVVGGTGRAIIGRLVIPAGANKGRAWFDGSCQVELRVVETDGPELGERPNAGRNLHRGRPATIAADGSFRCDDVPAGDYEVVVQVYEPLPDPRIHGGGLLAFTGPKRTFNVPPMPGGRSDEPLDLGSLELTPRP
jgi:hypothetical protein